MDGQIITIMENLMDVLDGWIDGRMDGWING